MMTASKNDLGPPEGGWGYMIAAAMCLVFGCIVGPWQAFGLVFSNFLKERGDETSISTLIFCTFGTTCALMGLFANKLTTMYSLRQVGVTGALLFFTGGVLTIFVDTITELVVANGILQGIGFGLVTPVTFASLNNYFVERRPMINGIVQTGIGMIVICFPMLIELCLEEYGFRGTVAIIAAVNLHCLLGCVIMQPVEWHMVKKKKLEQVDNNKPLILDEIIHTEEPRKISGALSRGGSEELLEVMKERKSAEIEKLLPENGKVCDVESLQNTKINNFKNDFTRSLSNIPNWSSLPDITTGDNTDKKKGFCNSIVESLDLTLLTDPVYVNISLGCAFSFLSDITIVNLTPFILFHRAFTSKEIAMCLTVAAMADLSSRIFLMLTAMCATVKSRHYVFAGTAVTVIFRTIFAYQDDFYMVTICIGAMGFLRSWIQTPLALVFAEEYGADRFPATYGLYMVISGLLGLILGTMTGVVAEMFKNDILIINLMTCVSILCAVPWAVEMIICRRRKNKLKTIN